MSEMIWRSASLMLGMRLTIVSEPRPYCGRGAVVLNDILVNENGLKEAGSAPTQSYDRKMSTDQRDAGNPLKGLGAARAAKGPPPVHLWNPPFCGDIDMRIAQDGTWFYMNSPIGRKPLVQLFSSVLRQDEDGKYYLVTPVEKVGIRVDDAPFTAVRMAVEGEGRGASRSVSKPMWTTR